MTIPYQVASLVEHIPASDGAGQTARLVRFFREITTGRVRPTLSVGPQTVVASDGFARPNDATHPGVADTGEPWTPVNGTWGIDAHRLYCSTFDTLFPSGNLIVLEYHIAGLIAETTIAVQGVETYVVFNCTDYDNCLLALITSAGTLLIGHRLAGVVTIDFTNASFGAIPPNSTFAAGYDLATDTVTAWVNGLIVATASVAPNATLRSGTRYGVGVQDTVSRFDDFSVSDRVAEVFPGDMGTATLRFYDGPPTNPRVPSYLPASNSVIL